MAIVNCNWKKNCFFFPLAVDYYQIFSFHRIKIFAWKHKIEMADSGSLYNIRLNCSVTIIIYVMIFTVVYFWFVFHYVYIYVKSQVRVWTNNVLSLLIKLMLYLAKFCSTLSNRMRKKKIYFKYFHNCVVHVYVRCCLPHTQIF